jgi:hypothetical protein
MPTSSRLPWCISLLLHSQRGRAWRLVCADPLTAWCFAQHQEEGRRGRVSGGLLVRSPALPRLLYLPSDPTLFVAATITGRFRPAPATPRAADYRLDSIFSSSPGLMAGNRRFCCPPWTPAVHDPGKSALPQTPAAALRGVDRYYQFGAPAAGPRPFRKGLDERRLPECCLYSELQCRG